LKRVSLGRLGLILTLGLLLAACGGQPPMTTWPGLAANDQLAFVAAHQQLYAVHISGDNYSKAAWAFPAAADPNNIGNFVASPAVGPNVIIAAADGPSGRYSGAVFGLNPENGQQIWCLALDAKAAGRLPNCPAPADVSAASGEIKIPIIGLSLSLAAPEDNRVTDRVTLAGDTAYFGLNNGKVYAVDAMTGKTKWPAPFQAKQAVWAAPVADPATGLVFVGSLDHNLYVLDMTSGALRDKKDLGAAIAASPVLSNGVLYVGTFGSKVFALDTSDRSQKWPPFVTVSWVWGTPVLYGNGLYFADVAGNVYAVDAATGQRRWSVKPGDALRAAPVVTAEAVVVGDRTGKIYGLNRANGAGLWPSLPALKGQLIGSPVVISDTILVAPYNGDNLLVAYSLTGAQTWAFAPTQGK
jgi:outer membrane protein assembly factor BamB